MIESSDPLKETLIHDELLLITILSFDFSFDVNVERRKWKNLEETDKRKDLIKLERICKLLGIFTIIWNILFYIFNIIVFLGTRDG